MALVKSHAVYCDDERRECVNQAPTVYCSHHKKVIADDYATLAANIKEAARMHCLFLASSNAKYCSPSGVALRRCCDALSLAIENNTVIGDTSLWWFGTC